jgi:acetyl-CoA acyltransferase
VASAREAVIVDVVRTPVGRRGGMLKGWHPVDLLAFALTSLIERTGIEPGRVDDVIAGCVSQVGEQSINIARQAVLAAGFPESVPATTVDRQCGSGQQAIHFAAQGVISGAYDIAIACGVESMTRVPLGSSIAQADPLGKGIRARYPEGLVHQGVSAELVAERWGLTRADVDAYGLESHRRAAQAAEAGWFAAEITPITVQDEGGATRQVARDEGIRPDTSMERLATLKTAFKEDGVVTAGNASQISDGAAAALIVEAGVAERLGLRPRARIVAFALAGDDPRMMLTAPIPATRKALDRAGLGMDDIDLFEINEAFASVVLAWQKEMGADLGRTNVNGGAIALGHPLGASGVRIMATLVNELERRQGRYGLQTMCEGGGLANATIIERI